MARFQRWAAIPAAVCAAYLTLQAARLAAAPGPSPATAEVSRSDHTYRPGPGGHLFVTVDLGRHAPSTVTAAVKKFDLSTGMEETGWSLAGVHPHSIAGRNIVSLKIRAPMGRWAAGTGTGTLTVTLTPTAGPATDIPVPVDNIGVTPCD